VRFPGGLQSPDRRWKNSAVGCCEVGCDNKSCTCDGVDSLAISTRWRSVLLFSLLVAAAGGALIYHYNRRMTGARTNATGIQTHLSNNKVDLSAVSEQPNANRATRSTSEYDAEELYIFGFIIAGSVVPSFLVWVLP
jgi:hypothetical protein